MDRETLNWRYSMYVNLAFAGIAIAGALTLLHNQAPAVRPRLDIPGVLSVSAGLFSVVYGFSHAQTTSWRNHTTLGFLVGGVLLLAAFAAIESRSTNKLRPRLGPRPLAVTGMLLGGAGMLYLTRLSGDSSYATGILPALIVLGIGLGLVFSTSINSATLGVQPADAGVASATVSAAQQIGGSLGTALLTTIAASAISNYTTSAHTHPTRLLLTHATVHGDTSAFAWAAATSSSAPCSRQPCSSAVPQHSGSTRPPRRRPPTDHHATAVE